MREEIRRFWIATAEAVEREWLLAEAFEAGASGAEEDEAGPAPRRFRASIYAPPAAIEGVRAAVAAAAPAGVRVGAVETLADVDWSEAWKAGLEAMVISPRLVVRPPFAAARLAPGQQEVVIEPGQAFGTGAHASTRLCLEWIDALLARDDAAGPPIDRMLDVGTGSGVLSLAALRLGCVRAVGFDLDPVAVAAAREAARANGLADRLTLVTGPIDAILATAAIVATEAIATTGTAAAAAGGFPLVVANLLKREVLPIAGAIAARLAPGGRLVLAGLLAEDLPAVLEAFGRFGLVELGRRSRRDGIGDWVSPCLGPVAGSSHRGAGPPVAD